MLAFAWWTVVYTACMALNIAVVWAQIAGALGSVLCAYFLALKDRDDAPLDREEGREARRGGGRLLARVVNAAAAIAAAVVFAFVTDGWVAVAPLWLLAAAAALAWMNTGAELPRLAADSRLSAVVAVAWAFALGVFSLFVVSPDGDDSQYLHVSSWIAAHGRSLCATPSSRTKCFRRCITHRGAPTRRL